MDLLLLKQNPQKDTQIKKKKKKKKKLMFEVITSSFDLS